MGYTTIFELDPQVVSPGVIQTKETFVGKWLSPLEQELLACRALWESIRWGLVEEGACSLMALAPKRSRPTQHPSQLSGKGAAREGLKSEPILQMGFKLPAQPATIEELAYIIFILYHIHPPYLRSGSRRGAYFESKSW